MSNFDYSNLHFEDVIQVEDLTDRIDELEEQQTPRISAGYAQKCDGCMPSAELADFDNFDDAKRHIIEMIKNAEEQAETEEMAESLAAFAEDVNLMDDEFSTTGPDGLVYWVTDTGEKMGLDSDETEELEKLTELVDELQGMGGDHQWRGNWYPASLIRDSYFNESMDELVADCYELPEIPSFMTITLDYDALQQDYSSVEINGVTYWCR